MDNMMTSKAKMDEMMTKAHGRKTDSVMMAHQGASVFMSGHSAFPAQNPLTKTGKEVMESMEQKYGKRAKKVFYKSINKGVPGSKKWHR